MSDNRIPLYYAIVKSFLDQKEYCADDLMEMLRPEYHSYKLLTPKDVEEALATAKENGLLDEVRCDVVGEDHLRIFYQMNDFGTQMVNRYLD